ncbi:MAG: hypothetical protein D9V46_06500 [Deltaproteobacteria bacterium]|nr:MAG: hypothetical protein D9V46_06500 [Deltaproteobacteria bacterium]
MYKDTSIRGSRQSLCRKRATVFCPPIFFTDCRRQYISCVLSRQCG